MEELRNVLLLKDYIITYGAFLNFMQEPASVDIDESVNDLPSEVREMILAEMQKIMKTYATNKKEYFQTYRYGQVIIWQEILKAYKKMQEQKEKIELLQLSPDISNYSFAVKELSRLLYAYAEMQICLSDLESVLGVDRFLDRVSETTFEVLNHTMREAKSVVEEKCVKYKSEFQSRWNTTNVYRVLGHKLVNRNIDNQVCECCISNDKHTILFVIDGFGFCQYLWNIGIDAERENYTFNENIFNWLRNNMLSRELILGSSFVTDTAAGLSQIYLGRLPKDTRIVASKVRKRASSVPFVNTKQMSDSEFVSIFTSSKSITDVVTTFGLESKVYYCSKYSDTPLGFSNCIFKSATVESVVPSERVFSILLDNFEQEDKGLTIVYLTGIDNSGHTMGAYSGFERQEHVKIDLLLRNFLIELAYTHPDAFDGKRSILITADHGMYESSKIMVSRYEILDGLNENGIRNVKLVENNRAMLFYNEGTTSDSDVTNALVNYFKQRKLNIEIKGRNDLDFIECIGTNISGVMPNIIARFVGEGLFYTSQQVNEHLLHFGGHGGCSVDEVFVPLIEIPLDNNCLKKIGERFISRK